MFPSALVHLNPALAVQLAAALVVQPDGGGGAPSPTVLRLNLADSRRASAFKRPPKRRPAPAAAPTGHAIRGPVATIGGGGVWAAKGRRLSGHNNAPAASAAPAPPAASRQARSRPAQPPNAEQVRMRSEPKQRGAAGARDISSCAQPREMGCARDLAGQPWSGRAPTGDELRLRETLAQILF